MENNDNYRFYNKFPIEEFVKYSESAGLDTCVDLDLIRSKIELFNSESILEIGAGFGRVIQYLLKNKFQGKITAIERNPIFYAHLANEYGHAVTLHKIDVKELTNELTVDVILFLWAGMEEFNAEELKNLLSIFKRILKEDGCIFMDCVPWDSDVSNSNSDEVNGQYSKIIYNDEIYLAFTPTEEEFVQWAHKAGFSDIEILPYTTTTNRKRLMYKIKN